MRDWIKQWTGYKRDWVTRGAGYARNWFIRETKVYLMDRVIQWAEVA
jgi:hypothetical protein